MESKRRYRKWTKELIIEEAKKYEYRSDFKKSEPNLYKKIIKEGWTSDAFSHMVHKPSMWTREACYNSASKCKTKSEFAKKFNGAYSSAKKRGWLNDISKKYFTKVGSRGFRCIYAYEFPDNCVYVGLTFDIQKRNQSHMHSDTSAVFKHMKKTGLTPKLIILTDYVDINEASELEGEKLEEYVKNNWIPLNRAKTGGTGSVITPKKKHEKAKKFIWTNELIAEEAKKYNTRKEFSKNSPSAYSCASKKRILDTVCSHMLLLQRRKWTKSEAQKEALRYETRGDFGKYSNACYIVSARNGWLDDICNHMKDGHHIIYTTEIVKDTVSKYEKMQHLRDSDDKFVRGCYWWLKKKKLIYEYKKFLRNGKVDN